MHHTKMFQISKIHTDSQTLKHVPNEPLTLRQLLLNIDYQLFTWMFVFAASIGLTFGNNITVIARSFHLDQNNGIMTI
jgi:hypothetical protein